MCDIDKQNETLVERLLTGDMSARDELIVFNRRLVYTTVKRILHTWPNFQYFRDDLIGVGMVALVQAVDRLTEIGEAARPIRNYLITAIRSKLLTELAGQDGDKGLVAHCQSIRYVDTYSRIPEHVLAVDDPIFNQIENREFFLSLCESDREREILILFLEGHRLVDIVEITGHTKNVINKTFRQFREKLRNTQENMSGLTPV